eukprot:TRINITY_DN29562_c0_g1_i1.p1 TRINITY_DN29562_c0_g1~~TRINITY_DN29562_c0_g1_i1.p1  ORF type:complete len:399 (+),score=99.85 TRINITY_DN29562_c0_g1_i1:85-1281(+)
MGSYAHHGTEVLTTVRNVPTLDEIRQLPKVDLHAHLSGSISQDKLCEMLEKRGHGEKFTKFDCRLDLKNALFKCFDYFANIAKVVTDLDTLKEGALHVFDSWAEQNCMYLEMRTTPKCFKVVDEEATAAQGKTVYKMTSKQEYLQTVSDAIDEFKAYAQGRFGQVMEIKLMLSVNRGAVKSFEDALKQIDDVLESARSRRDLVVGVDICGDPAERSAVPHILPALLKRKDAFKEFPITFHTAEVEDDEECYALLKVMRDLNIRRLGHVIFPPQDFIDKILAGGIHEDGGAIGIELCPTSNLVTGEMTRGLREEHHFPKWWKKGNGALISINTDDTGLFLCDLSTELYDIAEAFDLTWDDLVDIQRMALESSFHPCKDKLLARFEQQLSEISSKKRRLF